MATCRPQQVFTCTDATDLANLKTYLDRIGYKVDTTTHAERKDEGLVVTIDYPEWTLEV